LLLEAALLTTVVALVDVRSVTEVLPVIAVTFTILGAAMLASKYNSHSYRFACC